MNTFFIAGEQRSGTTLLSVVLSRHSQIYLDGHSIAFRLVSCFAKHYGQILPYNASHSRESIQSWLVQNDYKGRLADLLDPQSFKEYPNVRAAISDGISKRLRVNKKQVFGDKSPRIQHFMPDLLALIPDARFLHIVRDGRAVAASMNNRTHKNLELAAQEWVESNAIGLANQAMVGEDQYKIIRYEDLLTEPESIVKEVCDFLKLPFEPQMIEESETRSDDDYVSPRFETEKIDAFKSELSQKQIRKIEKWQAPLLQRFGYALIHPASNKRHRQLPQARRIWLNQMDNLRNLFIARRTGMRNRKNIVVKVPFKTRLKTYVLELGRDFLSDRVFKRVFRKRWIKEVYMPDDD